jgi:hypothetical protein
MIERETADLTLTCTDVITITATPASDGRTLQVSLRNIDIQDLREQLEMLENDGE